MYTALVAIQLILAIGIIALVLMQHGKGADAGAAFGSGASGTVFGARGSANFLSRSTGILAALFFLVSLTLAVIVARGQVNESSVVDRVPTATMPLRAPAEDSPGVSLDVQSVPVTEDSDAAASDSQSEAEAPAAQGAPE